MKVNYQRSYLTLYPPGSPDDLRPEAIRDICLQRALDATFMNISSKTEFSYVYFGSASGVFRAFPGRERQAGNDTAGECGNYQLHRRPWYKNAISVQKQLKILVDTGNSMGSELPPNYPPDAGSTLLEVSSNIVLKMLKTVSPDDFVDVATFNSSGYYPLGSQVQVSSSFDDSEDSTELAALEASVKDRLARSSPGLSNLTGAILNAVGTFRDAPADTLKVIVIFTDGQFSPLTNTTILTAQILAWPVKIILFKFPLSGETDPFLNTTLLPNFICGVQGTFELLDAVDSTRNPLYAIRSFYTFMARTQLAVAKNQSTWSARYLSYSQPLNGTSVTYPAFGSDGQLIGVAGIDIYPEEFNSTLRDSVYRALETRTAKGNMPAPVASINLACSYQTAVRSEKCNGSPSVANGGVCKATDSTGLQQRVCCDSCQLATTDSSSKKNLVLKVVLPLAVLIPLILCIGYFLIRHCSGDGGGRDKPINNPPPDT
ncbi:hypothetical protein KC19_5G198300 [Ceratodon purpureus]|nr:hypothetical protein KC19_5G198300 [Ceratodon purpureus]KAG0578015.1 hypothetical protein KC19_5G198300 [Ceratodon purpureus]